MTNDERREFAEDLSRLFKQRGMTVDDAQLVTQFAVVDFIAAEMGVDREKLMVQMFKAMSTLDADKFLATFGNLDDLR